jgi:hypothetical protein
MILSMLPDPLQYLSAALCSTVDTTNYTAGASIRLSTTAVAWTWWVPPQRSGTKAAATIHGGQLWRRIKCCHPFCGALSNDESETHALVLTRMQLQHPVIKTWRTLLLFDTAASNTVLHGLANTSYSSSKTSLSTPAQHLTINNDLLLQYLASLTTFSHMSSMAATFLCMHSVWELVALLWQSICISPSSYHSTYGEESSTQVQWESNKEFLLIRILSAIHIVKDLLPSLVISTASLSAGRFFGTCVEEDCHQCPHNLGAVEILDVLKTLTTALPLILTHVQLLLKTRSATILPEVKLDDVAKDVLDIVKTVLLLAVFPSFVAAVSSPTTVSKSNSKQTAAESTRVDMWMPRARSIICSLLVSMESSINGSHQCDQDETRRAQAFGVVSLLLDKIISIIEIIVQFQFQSSFLISLLGNVHLAVGQQILQYQCLQLHQQNRHLATFSATPLVSWQQRWVFVVPHVLSNKSAMLTGTIYGVDHL